MAPEMRAKCAVVAQALLLPLCGKMASAVTQCKDINTCSECSGHTFGCENPGLLEESWPWGTSMADPSVRMHAACKELELDRMHPLAVRLVSAKFGALGLTPPFCALALCEPADRQDVERDGVLLQVGAARTDCNSDEVRR